MVMAIIVTCYVICNKQQKIKKQNIEKKIKSFFSINATNRQV